MRVNWVRPLTWMPLKILNTWSEQQAFQKSFLVVTILEAFLNLGTDIMDNPGEAKFGMTKDQLFEAFAILKEKGAKTFGIHSFLASNTVTHLYYPELARQLLNWLLKSRKSWVFR